MAKKVGRPKSEFEESKKDFPKDWYDIVLKEYKEGASDVEIKAMFWEWRKSFSNDLWDRWLLEEKEFSETIKMGRALSHSWWLKKGRKSLDDREFSYTGWYMNMKNRFGWADKKEIKEEKKVETTFDYSNLDAETLRTIIKGVKPDKDTE